MRSSVFLGIVNKPFWKPVVVDLCTVNKAFWKTGLMKTLCTVNKAF